MKATFRKYSLFLFDADNTLFDFTASERQAFLDTLASLGEPKEIAEALLPTYKEISHELWGLLEQGKITQQELRTERFRRLFEAGDLTGDPAKAGVDYLDHLAKGTHLIEGALEVCEALRGRGVPIGIVTNGFKRVQEPRFKASALFNLVEHIVISEECGYTKPDRRIFDHALERARHANPETVLFVGDRLEADIQGAANAGLASCWFNPKGEANGTGIRPSYEIAKLTQLLE